MNYLPSREEYTKQLQEAGFVDIQVNDATRMVFLGLYRLFRRNPISQFHIMRSSKSGKYLWATGQSYLANRMEDRSFGQSVVVRVCKPNFGSFCHRHPFVCPP